MLNNENTELKGSVKELNMFHNYETEKITRKASDAAEYIELIVMHNTFNVILWTSANICVIVHDDLGWKNRTTRYNCRFSVVLLALRVIFVHQKRLPIYASCMTILGGRTEQYGVIGCGELAAVE